MQRVLLNPRLCLNNVCFPLQINASVITDSWNDGSAALQIKLFNHPVSISFCFAVIVPLLWHHDVMSTTHPRAVLVAAGLGASRVSRSSKNETTTKKNKLADLKVWSLGRSEALKQRTLVCCAQHGTAPQTSVRFDHLCSKHKHGRQEMDTVVPDPQFILKFEMFQDPLVQFLLVPSQRWRGTSVAHFQLVPLLWWARAVFGPEPLQVSTN